MSDRELADEQNEYLSWQLGRSDSIIGASMPPATPEMRPEAELKRADNLVRPRTLEELREAVREGAEKPTNLTERVDEAQQIANGHIIRAYLAAGWHLFDRRGRELHVIKPITEDGRLIIGVIEYGEVSMPKGMRCAEAEFVGEDLLIKTEWINDRSK